jgi:hypothetical protein
MSTYKGKFSDQSDAEGWKQSPVTDKKLAPNPLLSKDFDQPKFTDWSGGKSARRNNKLAEFQTGREKVAKKNWS